MGITNESLFMSQMFYSISFPLNHYRLMWDQVILVEHQWFYNGFFNLEGYWLVGSWKRGWRGISYCVVGLIVVSQPAISCLGNTTPWSYSKFLHRHVNPLEHNGDIHGAHCVITGKEWVWRHELFYSPLLTTLLYFHWSQPLILPTISDRILELCNGATWME